ncbi:MAG TPA: hypothetical protein VL992_09770 [Tepidisphaeraceae bacterium]|nr:hypothetical protein [Tepidisphaeraceae bacterium]
MKNRDFEPMRQAADLWLETLARMGSTFASVPPGSPPPEAARQLRGAMMNAMSEQAEQFMRSDVFLQWMKQSLDRAIDFQKQSRQLLTQMRHGTEGVAVQDMTAIMSLLHQMEDRMLDRLDDLTDRLDRLEKAVAAPAGNGEAKGTQP